MWAPFKEVAHFAILMGALVAVIALMEVAGWLVKKIEKYFYNKE